MKDNQNNNNNSFHSRNSPNENDINYPYQDNDDIIRKISQITPNEDKSFESSLMQTKNIPRFFDYKNEDNFFSKDSNIPYNEDNSTNTNKNLFLNRKLKYLCSLIQSSNINIKKYDDLKQFDKYLYNKNLVQNFDEPINILFDIICDLIFYIIKEIRNNDILMKEIKRLKYKENDNERIIYKLKCSIKEKDKENSLRVKKNEEYYKYNLNEINDLKKENKELYKKINTYKTQMKNTESKNKIMLKKLNSYSKENLQKNNISKDLLNNMNITNIQNLNNIIKLNGSYDDSKCNLIKTNLIKRNSNYFNKKNRTINYNTYSSASMNGINIKEYNSSNYNTIDHSKNDENKNYNNKKEDNLSSMKTLLKEINEMLKKYNSTLDKININHVINKHNSINKTLDEGKIKSTSDFLYNMDNKIKKIENYMKENNNNKSCRDNLILVNTSKWKFRKKTHKKEEMENNSLNNQNINEISSKSFNNNNIYHKKTLLNCNINNISCSYKKKYTININENP